MKLTNILKCLTITTLLTQLAISPTKSYADTEKSEIKTTQAKQTSIEKPENGLLGYYFNDNQFGDLAIIQPNGSSELYSKNKIEKVHSTKKKQEIHSARWLGYIKPSVTGKYQFSTSNDKNIIIQLNGDVIMNQSPMKKSLKLEKGKLYEIKIEYQRNSTSKLEDLDLFWSISGIKKERIPDKNLLAPDFTKEAGTQPKETEDNLIPKIDLFEGQKQFNQDEKNSGRMLQDTDKDGIPDEWELNGYTIKEGVLTRWDDVYNSQGYSKFLSHPYKSRTAADPYTDLQKVTGYMPAATKSEARDPLVAAYPAVGVGMEKLLFSKNENVTEGATNTKSTSTTKTNGTTQGVDVSANFGWSKVNGFSFGVSSSYSHSWNSSTSIDETEGESWSKQIGINTDQAAFLNANVRYYNSGTAPIYEVRPTTNLVLKNANYTLDTIIAGPSQIGNSLSPGETYPRKGQAPISLDTANEMGTVKISLNARQLDSIQSQDETIYLETTQSSGQYGILDSSTGDLVTDSGKKWDHIRSNIDAISGSLILETGKETLERRVAARDVNDPEDRTPEITVKEAIKKAFGAIEKDGLLYYIESETGEEIPLHENAVNIVVDEITQREFDRQFEETQNKSIYDFTFKRDMNITLQLPFVYYDFESPSYEFADFTGVKFVEDAHTGKYSSKIVAANSAVQKEKLYLEPYTNYTVSAWMKSPSTSFDISLGSGFTEKFQLEGDEWKLLELSFNTGDQPENFDRIVIKNHGWTTKLFFDDVAITKWYEGEDIKRNHVLSQWNATKPGYVDGLRFSRVPTTEVRYQLEIDGKLTDIKSAPQVDSEGKRYIDFKDFNNGKGIYVGNNIIVYAVDNRNDKLKIKVAEYADQELINRLRPSSVSFFLKPVQNYSWTFEIKTGANAPNAYYKVWNITKNEFYDMWSGGPNVSIWADWIKYNPKDEYALVAVVDGKEYVVYKNQLENIPGDKGEGVYIFEAANYQGKSQRLKTDISNFKDIGMNDILSSFRIIGYSEVILYEHANFTGKSVRLKVAEDNLKDIGFNDTVSSMKIIK